MSQNYSYDDYLADTDPDGGLSSSMGYEGLTFTAGNYGSHSAYASQDDYADYLERSSGRYDRPVTSGFGDFSLYGPSLGPDERMYSGIGGNSIFASASRDRGTYMADDPTFASSSGGRGDYMADDYMAADSREGEALVSNFFSSLPEREAPPPTPRITARGDNFDDFEAGYEPLYERMENPVYYDDRIPAQPGSQFDYAEEAFRSAVQEAPPRIPDRSIRTSGVRYAQPPGYRAPSIGYRQPNSEGRPRPGSFYASAPPGIGGRGGTPGPFGGFGGGSGMGGGTRGARGGGQWSSG